MAERLSVTVCDGIRRVARGLSPWPPRGPVGAEKGRSHFPGGRKTHWDVRDRVHWRDVHWRDVHWRGRTHRAFRDDWGAAHRARKEPPFRKAQSHATRLS